MAPGCNDLTSFPLDVSAKKAVQYLSIELLSLEGLNVFRVFLVS